jgi:DHA2 family multidrug resistance protein
MGGIGGSKAGITAAVMAAALMAFLDISIVNVALSDIRASFGTPIDQIGWVSTGYMMSNVVVIPITGWLQARFGFRRCFAGSILLFTAASALCGLAWSLPSLVAFRALQGLGGGAIIPTAQSLLLARYPRHEHNMAGALFGLGAITGPLLGPTVGGYLIDWSSWHFIFYVNLPVGLAAAWLAWRHIEEPGFVPAARRIDWVGIALLAVGMPALQYVLEEGNREGWLQSGTIRVAALAAALALVTFVVHELESPDPVVDLRVFRNRSYAAGSGINFLLGITIFAGGYVLSLYCGAVLRYSALDIGRVFLCAGLVQIVTMPLIGRFAPRFDGRQLIAVGIAGVSLSLWMNTRLTAQSGFVDLVSSQLVRAASIGFVFISLAVAALSDLPERDRGSAAGLFNLTRELGGSIGTAWMGMTLDEHSRSYGAQLVENVSAYHQPALEQLAGIERVLGAANIDDASGGALAVMELRARLQSLVLAFDDCFWWLTASFACGVALVLLLRKSDPNAVIENAH